MNGPHFTSVFIGENSYFVNKMAPVELSSAPLIKEGRSLVPVEFIPEILGYGTVFEDGELRILDEPFPTLSGYIHSIENDNDVIRLALAKSDDRDADLWDTTILIVSKDTMLQQAGIEEGQLINAIHMPVMTMSMPPQTGEVIIY